MSFAPEEKDFFDDPTVSTVAICDYETFLGDTLKEKYESIYVKIIEVKNVLVSKAEDKGLDVGKFSLRTGKFFAELVETFCHSEYFPMGEDRCMVFLDKSLHANKVLVECKAGRGVLIINNIPQLEEYAYKST